MCIGIFLIDVIGVVGSNQFDLVLLGHANEYRPKETKICFEQTLISHFSEFFIEKNLVVTQNVTDTIRIDFLVNNKGSLSISNIQSKPLTRQQIPGLDSLITHSLQGLPKLYPAIKRSQLVQSAFQLPLILVVK